jgi:3-oxoacyl-[acyl-carrier-protein] synthase-3
VKSGVRYRNVCLETAACILPEVVVSSEEIEQRLKPVYDRLGLPEGRLEMMTGIRERRFFRPGTKPGEISARTVRKAIESIGIDPQKIGALIHGSVCRDQMEPATAARVHAATGLPETCLTYDVSNACLGLLNGMQIIADLIEARRIEAGIAVGTETGRGLVEGTIDSLLHDPSVTRQDAKLAFASLTIGSGSAAVLLCHRDISKSGHRFLGGAWLSDTESHDLCAGGVAAERHGDSRPRMVTDSEGLLHAGIALAERTWELTKSTLGWTGDSVDRVFTHQVGKAHRKMLMEKLGLNPELDFPTVERFGNTGAAALPMALALGIEEQILSPGDRVALLGIGSGLNALMYGIEWA